MKKNMFLLLIMLCNIFDIRAKEHVLSFVMPCYNCSATMRRSIDSIFEQHNLKVPWEVVCTDDGSKDNTLQILREYEKKYSNFRVIAHEKNQGGGAACNTCVYHAKGDLLFRLDSDNVLAPDSVQKLIDLLDETGADGAAFQEKRFFHKNFEHIYSWFYYGNNNVTDLEHILAKIHNPSHSGNYLYTRKSFDKAGGYPTKHGSDTFCFGFKQYATGSKIVILPGTFYWHYHNLDGYWGREEGNGNNQRVAWKTLREYAEVFAPESRQYLASFDLTKNKLFNEWGKLKVAPKEGLEHLFKAYDAQYENNYALAAAEFALAIEHGCSSEKVQQELSRLLRNTKAVLQRTNRRFVSKKYLNNSPA